ncbi:MAG TPA: energy-coupling factor ABC transporter permease [Candidatus Acidoferrum sp.]|nr:energy-coupling factor ABC transporter permease [Candidatus Acidoferrum sp.]
MHIPDGFIDGKTAAAAAVVSAAGVGFALRQVRRELPPRKVPLLGLAAAFLFAAQMVNFPVAGGTSGHLVGGALVAALLGPSAAVVVVTTVLIVQCFLFQDGGVTALGANIFNMAIINSVAGYSIYRLVGRWLKGPRGQVTAIGFAAWCATVLAAICCAGQLAWSGTIPWSVAFPAMATVHMLIGVGEGLISALVFLAVSRARPDLIAATTPTGGSQRPGELLGYGLLVTLGVAVFVAPFACSWPDGLDSVAEKFGFSHKTLAVLPAPAPDYQMPGIHWAVGATATAGVIGCLIVFGLALLMGRWLVPKPKEP